MARTTKAPHKVSRNKSGTPIVRASKLFPGRPKRTTRETVFDTEQQARIFADALNLAAIRDGDWRWLKGEEWTAQRRYVDEVLRLAPTELSGTQPDGTPEQTTSVTMGSQGRGPVAPLGDMSMTEAVQTFLPVYMRRPKSANAATNYAGWVRAVGMAFEESSLAEVANMTPETCGDRLWRRIDPKNTTLWCDEGLVGGRTVNSRLNGLEQLLRYSIDNDWLIGQPRFFSATPWKAANEDPPIRWWDVDDLEAVLRELHQPKDVEEVIAFLMAEMLMFSGLRWGEIAALQWSGGQQGAYYWNGVDPSSSLLSVRVTWKRLEGRLGPTKTGNTWSAICTQNLGDTLRRVRLVTGKNGTFLFPRRDDSNNAIRYERWSDLFKEATQRAGVNRWPVPPYWYQPLS